MLVQDSDQMTQNYTIPTPHQSNAEKPGTNLGS